MVASEYARLTSNWIAARGMEDRFVRSYGATEVFPPEDADVIVDNTATGSTLHANGLEIVDEVLRSSTRLYASRQAMNDPSRRARIDDLVLLVRSVLEARQRVMLEVNVPEDRLAALLDVLPCMRQPTVSTLAGGQGYAVKSPVEGEGRGRRGRDPSRPDRSVGVPRCLAATTLRPVPTAFAWRPAWNG